MQHPSEETHEHPVELAVPTGHEFAVTLTGEQIKLLTDVIYRSTINGAQAFAVAAVLNALHQPLLEYVEGQDTNHNGNPRLA